jgi:hypothetical protein
VTGQVSTADWTSTVQSDRWWRWNGGQRIPFVGSEVWLSSHRWCGQGWLKSAFFRRYLGLTEVPGRKPCLKLTMATPAGTVSSLGASSWHAPVAPPRAPGETLDSACRIGQRRHHGVVPFLEALSRSLVESPKRHDGVQVGGRLEQGLPGRNVRRQRRFLVVFFRFGLAPPLTRRP